MTLTPFITRWQTSAAAERANYQLFLSELCDALDVPRPDPTVADEADNAYVFEKAVPLPTGAGGRIDLYRRGCFVLEAKQGSELHQPAPALSRQAEQQQRRRRRGTAPRGTAAWDTAMERAHEQAQSYARHLPVAEIAGGRPPLLLVVDVGQSIALYSEWTRSGGAYLPFPDPANYRVQLDDLRRDDVRELLRAVWLDPMSLDPSRRSARVTREIADRLARLARSLEEAHPAERVARFLMRCLFTMFAEDVGLLPKGAFTQLLADAQGSPASFPPLAEELWRSMAGGGFSVALRQHVPHIDGGLFEEATALPLSPAQIQGLIEAAQADWRDVEPAIFGTLLVRALDPAERHKLGAEFTPRAYVERLVLPTIVEPLREEWDAAKAAALALTEQGQGDQALAQVETFQRRLATVRVLDPACGSGNFLYVTLEHLKRLEGEVLEARRRLGGEQMMLEMEGLMVRPEQFHGLEISPWAAAVAELVLWIGFLQWHLRTRGSVAGLAEPILRNLHNIECRDAVLAWDAVEPLLDGAGQPVTRWDGRTTKPHPVTGLDVPDESALVPAWRYINPRQAVWPEVDYVVGNPPFVANRNLRAELGEGYVDALKLAYPEIQDAIDYVMYFWHVAARSVIEGKTKRSGLITTNSIRMLQNQGVIKASIAAGAKILFAIPDHPWPGEATEAKVRVSMTVIGDAKSETGSARLVLAPGHDAVATSRSVEPNPMDFVTLERQVIASDLSPLTDVSNLKELRAWENLCHAGMKPYARDLIISYQDAIKLFPDEESRRRHAPPYRNGSDVAQIARGAHVIDFFGLGIEDVRHQFPNAYQHLELKVKPQRVTDRNPRLREEWWLFEANRPPLREALANLDRFIVTVENAPRRYFVFLDGTVMPDQKLRVIASRDAYCLGVLSSRIHAAFAYRTGGRQGVANTPVYNTRCCVTFPFPAASDAQQARIRAVAEELDAHRKRQQAAHPRLTLTDIYNVLEKLRRGEALTAKERQVHEQGLASVLRQLHDELDALVAGAYGWPADLPDDEILARLVALNAERAAEEAAGVVRWLRPEYQAPSAETRNSVSLRNRVSEGVNRVSESPWPERLAEQAQAVRAALAALNGPATVEQVAAVFVDAPTERVAELLETLASLGQVEMEEGEEQETRFL